MHRGITIVFILFCSLNPASAPIHLSQTSLRNMLPDSPDSVLMRGYLTKYAEAKRPRKCYLHKDLKGSHIKSENGSSADEEAKKKSLSIRRGGLAPTFSQEQIKLQEKRVRLKCRIKKTWQIYIEMHNKCLLQLTVTNNIDIFFISLYNFFPLESSNRSGGCTSRITRSFNKEQTPKTAL